MQQAGNTQLAAALATGQTRNFSVVVKFDWLKNGLFADPNSNLSALFQTAVIDRQLTGDFPDEQEITEGYVAAEMTLELVGNLPSDGITPVWKAFSPYYGLSYGTVGAVDVPVTLDIVVLSALVPGGISVRQFTGYTSDALPDEAAGSVQVTCYDISSQLTQAVTLPTWAADQYTRVILANSYADVYDSGTTLLSWVLEHVLRKGNVYMGPQWNPWTVCAWTLNGSGLPSVGTIGIEDPQISKSDQWDSDAWTFGYGAYNIPQYTPAGDPATVWGAGKWGSTCFVGASKLPSWPGGRNVTYVAGNAHAATAYAPSASYGSANSNLLGMSVFVDIDPTQTGFTTMTTYLEDAQFNYSSGAEYPAYATLSIQHSNGAVSLSVKNNGWGKTWSWTGSSNVPTGWHCVYLNLQFTSTAVNANIYYDSTLIASGNGGTASTLGAPGYGFPLTGGNLCQVKCSGPAQYAQVWFQPNTALTAVVQPYQTVPVVGCVIDRSLTRLTWMPDIDGPQVWDVLKDAATGELGALYVDELGVVHFDNRSTIKGRKVAANSVANLTRDNFYNVQPESVLSSIVNQVPWSVDTKLAFPFSPVYSSGSANQYQVPANTTQTWPISNSGVQSIRLGNVNWHPQAQGYANPVNPGEYGGAGPSGTFTWQDWMQIYGPDFWFDGFTAYSAGSTSPGGQPPAATGLNAVPQIGTVNGGPDTRYMTLSLINSNTSGGALEFAVNDNTPFLKVGGTVVQDQGTTSGIAQDATSIAQFGSRNQPLPTSDWLQDAVYAPTLAASLLADTKQPKPYFQTADIVGDPRMQLQDVVTLLDPLGLGANMPVSVVGINRKIDSSSNGVRDTLTLRSM